jgi:hypothetical protein
MYYSFYDTLKGLITTTVSIISPKLKLHSDRRNGGPNNYTEGCGHQRNWENVAFTRPKMQPKALIWVHTTLI